MANGPSDLPRTSFGGERPEPSWKRAVQGCSVWVLPDPSPEEVADLVKWFSKVVEHPEEEVKVESERWVASARVAKSLGRKVAVVAVVREFWLRAGLKGEVAGYDLEQDHFLFCFKEAGERDLILRRPWVVARQMLVVEPWRPGFFPMEEAIRSAVVWVRLPWLSVELWREAAIRRVLSLAGDLVMVDDCMAEQRILGFARASMRIDLARPLRPGMLVKGPEGPLWQQFVYKSLEGVCYRCGCLHSPEGALGGRRTARGLGSKPEGRTPEEQREGHAWGLGWWSSANGYQPT